MSNLQITNGTVKYGRTVKTGDFESKRADVELAFSVPEGEDAENVIERVQDIAMQKCEAILGFSVKAKPAKKDAAVAEEKPAAGKAKKIPAVETSAEVEEPVAVAAKPAVAAKAGAAEEVGEDNIDDILGMEAPAKEKEITDKELNDATQKCQAENKNSPAIRKLIEEAGVKSPPGRIIDIAQNKRQGYLDGLKKVKPLA